MAKTEFATYNSMEAHAKGDAHLSDYLGNKARACSEKCRSLALIVEAAKTCSEVHGAGGAAGVPAARLATQLRNRAMEEEVAFLAAAVGAESALPNRFLMGNIFFFFFLNFEEKSLSVARVFAPHLTSPHLNPLSLSQAPSSARRLRPRGPRRSPT